MFAFFQQNIEMRVFRSRPGTAILWRKYVHANFGYVSKLTWRSSKFIFRLFVFKLSNSKRKGTLHLRSPGHLHAKFVLEHGYREEYTRSVNKVMRLIQYNSVLTFKLQIEFVPFKIVPLGGYTPPETLFPLIVATLVVANRNRF